MLRRILSSEKIVKGEGRIKYRNLFQVFFIPRRILSYVKIVKGEGKRQTGKVVFQLYRSFLLDPASQRGVTRGHTAPRCGIHEKLGQESPQNTFPFTFLSGPRVAARGDALGHTAPRCGIQEKIRQECPPNPFLSRPSLDPASQRGVTCWSYRTLMWYPLDMWGGEPEERNSIR